MENSIFKAYDIRGEYPDELNEAVAFKVGQAFTVFLKRKTNKDKLKIVLARDNRLSSESLFNNLERGILNQGGEVVDIGLATTPLFYFSVALLGDISRQDAIIIIMAVLSETETLELKKSTSELK